MDFKVTSRFVVFWICCAPFTLFAQHEEIVSRHYSMMDGLPEEGINAVIQDSSGFIWLGTYSGLCKFDGYRFTNYRNNPVSSNSLRNNLVNSLLEDKNGRLWIGHAHGIDLFDPKTEKFYFHWPDSEEGKNVIATKLVRRKDAKVWICTNQGVFVADPETRKIEKFRQISTSGVGDIGETKNGSIVYGDSLGFNYIDSKTGQTSRFTYEPLNPKSIKDNFVSSLLIDHRDRIWIGTATSLELFNPREKSFTHYPTNEEVLSIQENPDGKLFLGCATGLFLFDPEDADRVERLTDVHHNVNSLTWDRQGILWVSSLEGLRQLNSKNKKFNIYTQFGNYIGPIIEDINKEVWILGTYEHVATVFKFNPATGNFHRYPNHFQHQPILSLFQDRQRNVWRVAQEYLEKYNPKSQTFQVAEQTYKEAPISTFMDSNGLMWGGGWSGLAKSDTLTGSSERLGSFPESIVYSFLEDSSQNLWVGSTAGLTRYNLKTGKLDVFNNQSNDPQSLSGNVVYHLVMDSDKNIWVGTSGGLNKMIKGTENNVPRFINWRTTHSELPYDDVYCIVDGGDGTLWMTCGNMISHFDPRQNTFRNYDSKDGLSGRNFRGLWYLNGKGLRRHNGSILFGSFGGLVSFHPDSLEDNKYVPPVIISSFSIQNQEVPVAGTDADTLTWETPLTHSISYTHEIRLTHNQNDFNLEFAALNFVNPERNQYKYKLEPYEKEWTATTADNRFARYTNISPGKYIFRVIGSNNDGLWNEKGASLVIVIAPPWWKTWWAYSLYGIAFAGLLAAARRNIIHRERLTAKLKLEHLELEKVQEIDKVKTNFFANISHEFRTPITLILGPLKEMCNGTFKGDQKSTLGVMVRNGQRLLRLINQLLDLSKLEVGKMSLQTSQSNLVQVLKEIASAHESWAKEKKIKFTLYFEVEELILFIDQEKIEKIMHNILSNAFKFTKISGEVILHLRVENNLKALISIKDTGIGIPAYELNKVFDRFYQVDSSHTRDYEGSGLGMALAKELVELHHGTISVESREGIGSTFMVRLPLGKEHLRKEEIIDADDFIKTKEDSQDLKAEENMVAVENGIEKTTIPSGHLPVLLIAEDNADMRHYIIKIMSDQYQIIEAENGKIGVALAEESVPDLIISDIMMPEMDGYKLCEILKTNELTSHIPIILLTAKADRESKLTGLETGADDYLSKPFDADELKLIVRNRIEERRKMRERFTREITLEPKQISITSYDEKFLNKVFAIIENHMDDENFSVEELSREVGYSNMHLYRKLKALAGETPSQFLRTIRLKRAAELLRKKSDNVTQIAYSVGFSSLSYFNKCFKDQFGVTPGQFAEENIKSKV